MKIELHPQFKKSYKLRITNNQGLQKQTSKRISLFQENSESPILKDHPLKGSKKKLRSFSVNGDIRIVYIRISKDHIIFLDIGSHNQVY